MHNHSREEDELYQEHILDHYEDPFHHGHLPTATHAHEDNNPLCGDVVRIELELGKDGKIRELADAYRKAQVDYLDGITVDNGDWWFNVRKSNTEPLLRLNLETESPEMLRSKMAELKKILGEPAQGH